TINIPGTTERGRIVARITLPDGLVMIESVFATSAYHNADPIPAHPTTVGGAASSGQAPTNPYSADEQMRIYRTMTRLAYAFAQQGNTAEANRIRNQTVYAVTGGASSSTLADSVRAAMIVNAVSIP